MERRKVIKKEHHKPHTKNIKEKRRIKKAKRMRRQSIIELTFAK